MDVQKNEEGIPNQNYGNSRVWRELTGNGLEWYKTNGNGNERVWKLMKGNEWKARKGCNMRWNGRNLKIKAKGRKWQT